MKRLSLTAKTLPLLLVASTLLSHLSLAGVVTIPEVQKFEIYWEVRLQERLRIFFGHDARISINIRAKGREVSPKLYKASAAAPSKSFDQVELGYLPKLTPEVPNALRNDGMLGEVAVRNFQIDSVQAELSVAADVSENIVKEAKSLVETSLKEYSPSVTVSKIAAPALVSDSKSEKRETAQASPGAPLFARTELIQILAAAAAVVLSLAIALIVGALRIAGTLKFASASVAEGLQAISTAKAAPPEKGPEAETKQVTVANPDKTPRSEPPLLPILIRNVKMVKQLLKEQPMLLIQESGNSPADWAGLRWLLPWLTAAEQDAMKQNLGEKRLDQIAQVSGETFSNEVQAAWLQNFIERLTLRKIRGGSIVEKATGVEKATALFQADPKALVTAAKSIADKGAWRILGEILPKNELEKVLEGLEDSQWHVFATATELEPDELASAADELISQIEDSAEDDEETDKTADVNYLQSLLDSSAHSLIKKNFEKQEQLLESLEKAAPQFTKQLRQRVWTPASLNKIPEKELAKLVKPLNNNDKALLVYGLPADASERVMKALPAGNAKTIVQDLVKKFRASGDAAEAKAAAAFCRKFLDDARQKATSGKIVLEAEEKTDQPGEASSQEAA